MSYIKYVAEDGHIEFAKGYPVSIMVEEDFERLVYRGELMVGRKFVSLYDKD